MAYARLRTVIRHEPHAALLTASAVSIDGYYGEYKDLTLPPSLSSELRDTVPLPHYRHLSLCYPYFMDAQLAHSTPTPSGYNPVLSRCVESSSLMNEELEALFSLPLTQGPGNAPCMKATDHEAGTGDASPEYNSAAPLAPGFGIVQASMPAHCVDLSALLSPPSHESSSSGAMSPGLAIEGSHPLVSPGSKRPDRGDGEILTVQGYCWKDNSCWLDSSLELIFQTAQRDWEGFARRFSNAPFSIKLHRVHDTLAPRHRLTVEGPPKDLERDLSAQRDQLREVLLKWGAIKLMQSREPSFVRQSNCSQFGSRG